MKRRKKREKNVVQKKLVEHKLETVNQYQVVGSSSVWQLFRLFIANVGSLHTIQVLVWSVRKQLNGLKTTI